jgi:hypothetical protein
MVLHDILQAWNDYVDNTILVTVTSAGVPAGQNEFNVGEKVKYDLNVTNGTSANGLQVNNIRLHRHASNVAGSSVNVIKFIVPPTSLATAFANATSTSALTPNTEQDVMFLEKSSMTTLTPGEIVTIPGLEVIGKGGGTAIVEAHVHATLNLDTLFPPDTTGKDGTKSLTVKT